MGEIGDSKVDIVVLRMRFNSHNKKHIMYQISEIYLIENSRFE